MVNGPQENHCRLWTVLLLRRGLFFLMAFVLIYLFYSTEIMPISSTERWMTKQRQPLDEIYKSHTKNGSSGARSTNGGIPGSNRAALNSTPALTNSTIASANTDTNSTNATLASAGGAVVSTGAETSHPSIPVPYVSPGPYLVEYPHQYHFIINEPQRCEQDKPFLVLLVPVAPLNKAQRDIIRATWGSESLVNGKVVKLFFLLGWQGEDVQQQVLQESKEHRDLIQSDFIDCYKNLTIKTMVMLEWLDSYCRGASYAMKIDSDVFLNMANLVNMITGAPKTNYMTGLVARNAPVLRDPSSKWYLPHDVYPPSVYPGYALGLGYVFSLDLAKKLIGASYHVKPLYIEDVFLGLCMQYLKISPTNPPRMYLFHVSPLKYSRCAFSRIIATTTVPRLDQLRIWKDFKKPGPYC